MDHDGARKGIGLNDERLFPGGVAKRRHIDRLLSDVGKVNVAAEKVDR